MRIHSWILPASIALGAATTLFGDAKPKAIPAEPAKANRVSEAVPAKEPTPWVRENYSFAYWQNGWRKNPDDRSTDILCFETGHYGFTLDLANLQQARFGFFNDGVNYPGALEAGTRRLDMLDSAELAIGVEMNGSVYRAITCKASLDTGVKRLKSARMWESGKLVQHFDLLGLVFRNAAGEELPCDATLDIVVWPNSLTLSLELVSSEQAARTSIRLKSSAGEWKAEGSSKTTLTCNFNQREQIQKGISITVTAPEKQAFPTTFETNYNGYVARVKNLKRSWKGGYTDIRNYDEFDIVVENTNGSAYVPFLLNLSNPANITGLCPILCDENGVPTGIPVQLSKNWHYEELGAYLRAYALIPALQGTSNYKLRIAYGFYGTLPSASHAQLSLVGWGSGSNGRWDQLAIGCWGETICFDADMSATDVAITDVRMLMTRNGIDGRSWSWTDAGWGGDWLNLRDDQRQKLYFKELKTAYLSHGPCLTEVRYDGYYGSQKEIDLKVTVNTVRTDDFARTFQTFRYHFEKPVSAREGWLFKMGRTGGLVTPKIAYGNSQGLIKEHRVPDSLKRGELYIDRKELTGNAPWWIAFPGAHHNNNKDWGTGSRALVIRSYRAEINNTIHSTPTISLPAFQVHNDGSPNLDLLLTPPKGVNEFNPDDSIEFEVEWITLPRVADDYYGPNAAFRRHLAKYPRSWKTVHREAKGNDLKLQTAGGTVKRTYPVLIEATRPDKVQLRITGGTGAVPVRFDGLEHPGYALYQVKGKERLQFDQSVHGNDFWQTDYNPESGTYSLTFNLPLDGLVTSGWILRADDPSQRR